MRVLEFILGIEFLVPERFDFFFFSPKIESLSLILRVLNPSICFVFFFRPFNPIFVFNLLLCY